MIQMHAALNSLATHLAHLVCGMCLGSCVWAQQPAGISTGVDWKDAALARRCEELLDSSLIDFYLPNCIDAEQGGYLEVLDDQGNFTGSDKFLTLQARQLWFFSLLAHRGIQTEASLAAAKQGYDFLCRKFYDINHGGYFAKTSRDGQPVDRRKHVYPNAFVIYAFVEYFRATQDDEALLRAKQLFETLETHCYDHEFGGYREFFYENWQPILDPTESGYIGAINTKTYNSHLHLLEAFTQLYLETQDELVASRLRELILINSLTVKHPDYACNIDGWNNDWSMIESDRNLRASYGHDVECAWLVLAAADALGWQSAMLRSWAKSTCDHAIRYGYDSKHGGFFYTGPLGAVSDDRKKEWWTQTEALVAMLTMYEMTGDSRYQNIFLQTLDFVEQNQVAPQGGWWATVNEDGSLGSNRSRTSMWQGAYHNGRALILCGQLLQP